MSFKVVSSTGFKREQIGVQLDYNLGLVGMTGKCPLDGNKWRRFHREVVVPANCDFDSFRAKFEDGILYVTMQETIASDDDQENTSPTKESPVAQRLREIPESVAGGRGGDSNNRTTEVGANEQTSDQSIDAANTINKEKKKEKEGCRDEGKMVDGSRKTAYGCGVVLGLNQSRQLMFKVVLAFLVGVALGIYVTHKA